MDLVNKLCDKGLLHFSVSGLCFYYFGFLYGVAAILAILWVSDLLLDTIGYVRLSGVDYAQIFSWEGYNRNMIGYFVYDKMKFEDFKQIVAKKAIKNIRKLRSVYTESFGMAFWKDIDIEIATKQITEIEENLNNVQDILNYCNRVGSEGFPPNSPMWEMKFLENYNQDESVLVIKLHHCLTDALGYLALLSTINDSSYTLKLPFKIDVPLWAKIYYTILMPYYAFVKVPSLSQNKTDPETKQFGDYKNSNTTNLKFFVSEWVELDKVKKMHKRIPNTSFNEYVWGIISVSFHQWLTKNGVKDPKQIVTLTTVGNRALPTCQEELNIDN